MQVHIAELKTPTDKTVKTFCNTHLYHQAPPLKIVTICNTHD